MKNVLSLLNVKSLTSNRESSPILYSLYDQFTTTRAAGAVNGTTAEPTGGTRTVTDTNSKISISGGVLSFATGEAASDNLCYSSVSRKAGQMFICDFNIAVQAAAAMGFAASLSGGLFDCFRFIGGGGIGIVANNTSTVTVDSYATSTPYKIMVMQRAAGTFYFIKGGTFTNWTLLWYFNLGTTGVFPEISTNNSTLNVFTVDNARIPQNLFLPTPLAYDTFTR